ncbi:hypothetical protein GRI62_04020 [Erythrobacter arachoides]|uniref:Uncharacterized protein n=1 Tax=Aurantiacibacter arachoides TaxID=1850444 RepID=A0A844ZY16_9SPHN|nr:hypothetical protein [Aurantiacibacter arachoides]MXO92775.1 hypothetical protein [Aurantiacibacter arachoides]GGD54578.1 hypothetical protein GCM10011411_13150 [Aurantiacibacter arachoides]
MTDQPPYDRFTLPGAIPDHAAPVSQTPTDEERARGYVLRGSAGRGWAAAGAERLQAGSPKPGGVGLPAALVRQETAEEKLARVLAEHGLCLKGDPEEDEFGWEVSADGGAADAYSAATGARDADANLAPLPQAGTGRGGEATAAGGGPVPHPSPDPAPIARSASGQPVAMGPAEMATFLEHLQIHGNVRTAAAQARVSRQAAYSARNREPGFARAWDACFVAARAVAEATLAERAIEGVEEVLYHRGEEYARRRRYDARLLLAHLARLDKAAERLDVAATLPLLAAQIAALRSGEEPGHALPARIDPDRLVEAQDEMEYLTDPRGVEPPEDYL